MADVARVTPWRWLIVILITALLLRVGAVLYMGVPKLAGYSESGMVAKNLATGKGFTFELFGERREQLHQLGLAPGPAAEAEQAEDPDRR